MGFYLESAKSRVIRRVRTASPAEWTLLGIFLFHILATLVASFRASPMPEEPAFTGLATNIAEHGKFELDFESLLVPANTPLAHFSPVWPTLLAIPWSLGLGEKGFFAVLALVWCFAAWLMAKCAEEMGLPRRYRWLAVAWLSLNPIYLYYHGHLMAEPLGVALALALFLTGFRFLHHPCASTVGPFAFLSGIAQLARGELILVSVALWLVIAFSLPWRKWAHHLALFALVHALVVSPWLLRMDTVGAGGVLAERRLGFDLYLANVAGVGNPRALQPGEPVAIPNELKQMSPGERDETLLSLAVQSIESHKLLYIKRCLYRLGYLLSPIATFTAVSRWQDWGLALATVLFFYAPWLGVFTEGVRARRWKREEVALLLAVVLWYTLHLLVNASIRYRIPSDAWLALAALSLLSRRIPKESVGN